MSKQIANIEVRVAFNSNKEIASIDVQYTITGIIDPSMSKRASVDKTVSFTPDTTLDQIMSDIISSIDTKEEIS